VAWITITEADLLEALSGDELAAYRSAALALDQPDPVAEMMVKVTNYIRGRVGGCAKNVPGPAGTIPDELLDAACALLAVRIPNRVGRSPKAGRADAAKDAVDLLKDVAACRFAIVAPETAAPEAEQPANAQRPSFSGRPRRDVRREQSGF
jgi:hypothetical protein